MVFALDKDNGELMALANPVEALTHCRPIDVKDGFWLFFADDGSPLEARFDAAVDSEDSIEGPGPFTLERPMSGLWLQERLDKISGVKGCGLDTLDDLVEALKVNRARRVLANRPR